MAQPETHEQMIAATRARICEIAEIWGVTCADLDVEVRLLDYVTIRLEHIPRADDD